MTASHSADGNVRGDIRATAADSSALPLAGLIIGAVAVAAMANPDTIEDGPVICPFRLMTGLPCPGCGLTRSWVYLVHGQWQDSLAANPFGSLLMLLSLGFVALVAIALVRRRALPEVGALLRRRPAYLLGAAWLVFAVARIFVQAFD